MDLPNYGRPILPQFGVKTLVSMGFGDIGSKHWPPQICRFTPPPYPKIKFFHCETLGVGIPNVVLLRSETEKANKLFQHKLFGAPHPKSPILGPQKEFMCLVSWQRTQKRDPHKLFWGDFWAKNRGPKRTIFGHKKFSLLFFPALIREVRNLPLFFSHPLGVSKFVALPLGGLR